MSQPLPLLLLSGVLLLSSFATTVVYGGGAPCPEPSLQPNQRDLHSSTNFSNVLGPSSNTQWFVSDVDADGVTWSQDASSQECARSVSACGSSSSSSNQTNYLVLDFVSKLGSPNGMLQAATFSISGMSVSDNCLSSCSNELSMFVYETSAADAMGAQDATANLTPTNLTFNASQSTTHDNFISFTTNETGFYLVILDRGSCVRITDISITLGVCPQQNINLVSYLEAFSGAVTGQCVENAVPDPQGSLDAAQCNGLGELVPVSSCVCSAAYRESNGTCSECANDFRADGGACTACPGSSTSQGGGASNCTCPANTAISGGSPSTTGQPCDSCVPDFYLSGGSCEECPEFSFRSAALSDSECMCNGGHVTAVGGTTTSSQPCSACPDDHFLAMEGVCMACPTGSGSANNLSSSCDCEPGRLTPTGALTTAGDDCSVCTLDRYPEGGGCELCPETSVRLQLSDTTCTCSGNTSLPDGSTTTTTLACTGCAVDTFRFHGECVPCPARSSRAVGEVESSCPCNPGVVRFGGPENNCVPTVGFTMLTATVAEGNPVAEVALDVSALPSAAFQVELSISTSILDYLPTKIVQFETNTMMVTVPLNLTDNDLAVEQPFTLSVLRPANNSNTSPFEIDLGGSANITVFIEDNDVLYIGFLPPPPGQPLQTVNESGLIQFTVASSTSNIGTEVTVAIASDDQTGRIPAETLVTFRPGGPTSSQVTIQLGNDDEAGQGTQNVTFSLSVVSPSTGGVTFGGGGGQNFTTEMVVAVVDDDASTPTATPTPTATASPFPLGGIIGVAVGGGVLLLLLIITLVVCVCCCRLKVNRRGFYETYEDKSNEPPTMLRYSASLRSISSQTVVPIDGRSAPKENEFYV